MTFTIKQLNELEVVIHESELLADKAEDARWEQARGVVEMLDTKTTSEQDIADRWINRKSGHPYSRAHVGYVARVWKGFGNLSCEDRPSFNEAYNSVEVRGPSAGRYPRVCSNGHQISGPEDEYPTIGGKRRECKVCRTAQQHRSDERRSGKKPRRDFWEENRRNLFVSQYELKVKDWTSTQRFYLKELPDQDVTLEEVEELNLALHALITVTEEIRAHLNDGTWAHKLLGVKLSSSPKEVQAAYRKLSKEHHPDAGGDGEQFGKIAEAYEYLTKPKPPTNLRVVS